MQFPRSDLPEGYKMNDYPVTERTRLRRAHERGHFDRETVYRILDAGLICHLGYVVDGQPFVTPTSYWRDGNRVYVHGSSASRAMRAGESGVEVCITVTLLDGLVMARSGFHHSLNYRSVMMFGSAVLVGDRTEKLAALEAFMERIAPGRWDECRPVTEQEIKATTVLALELNDVSAKIRTGPPVDDEEDYALPIWAGVVPVRQVLGAPEPDPRMDPPRPAPNNVTSLKF